ncbi:MULTISPECIES: DUF4304 domain-containing protein [unclassified Mesorhizobium]|uniref:DUF4304 domain-containing protein n=1 Tax=unclassified Mesorhizobium TaxID=325217 RepID=UPI00301453EE
MRASKELIVDTLQTVGARHGFKSSGSNRFYRDNVETIGLVNLQASRFGPSFHLNAAIWLRRLGPERRPKEYNCPVQWRVSSLLPEIEQAQLAKALDLDCPMPNAARHNTVERAIETFGFALIAQHATEEATRKLAEYYGSNILVMKTLRESWGMAA